MTEIKLLTLLSEKIQRLVFNSINAFWWTNGILWANTAVLSQCSK